MKIKESNLFLYSGTLFLVIKTVLSASKIIPYSEFIDTILATLGALCMVLSIIMQRYRVKVLFIYTMLIGITAYNAMITGNNALAVTVITCLAIRKTDLKTYIQFIFKLQSAFVICHTIIAIIGGMIGTFNIVQNIGGITRYDFGMRHPNSFAALAFNLMIMWIWLNWNKIKARHIIFMILSSGILYYFCKTRTNFIAMLAVIGFAFVCGVKHKFVRRIGEIATVIIPLLSVAMGVAIILYAKGNRIVLLLNEVLNARITLGAYALAHYSFTLFGQNMISLYTGTTWDPIWQLNAFTFDCVYTYMLINQGIIWLILLTILFAKLARRNNPKDNVAIISWALYGVTELQGLNCFSCMPILLLTKLFGTETE
jgi:hypothetical protein